MSMGSWLRTRRKQVITHTLIVGVFLFFVLFLSEPLFDRLERIPGEAQLQWLELPNETNNICFGIFDITADVHAIECSGWAFIEGHDVDLEVSRTYIVLKSDRHTYVFDTFPRERPDVTSHFEELGLNLDWAGFFTYIPLRNIVSGEYLLGIYITTGDIEALCFMDKRLVKSVDGAKLTVRMSEVLEISLPPESGGVRLGINPHEVTIEQERELVEITGWAFIEGQSAEDSKIDVVLRSETATYVFDTILQKRPDVTAYFEELGLNLDNSGFIARIPVDSVEEGTYSLGIYIKRGGIEALQYTDRLVMF